MDKGTILLVEDDRAIAELVNFHLGRGGFEVVQTSSGLEALRLARQVRPALVLLDWMIEDLPGPEVLRRLRAHEETARLPVILLTARGEELDRLHGFATGADDYVTKPFHMEELLARVRALLRRATGHATSEIACGPVKLDTRSGRVAVDGNPVKLTSHEYRLLSYLMHHTGRIVSRGELTEHLYDQDFDRDSNTIEVFIGRLRKKLGVDIIQTVRGLGYLLDASQTKT